MTARALFSAASQPVKHRVGRVSNKGSLSGRLAVSVFVPFGFCSIAVVVPNRAAMR